MFVSYPPQRNMRRTGALTAGLTSNRRSENTKKEIIIALKPIDLAELEQRTVATERLLSTLIAILSARDPRLLQELQAIFDGADFATDSAGRAAAATWARIARELKSTDRMMGSLGDDEQH